MWHKRHELISTVFNDALPEFHGARVVSRFMLASVEICSTEAPQSTNGNDSSEEEGTVRPKIIVVRHMCNDTAVKRTIIGFGWCFTTGSIAGVLLRNV